MCWRRQWLISRIDDVVMVCAMVQPKAQLDTTSRRLTMHSPCDDAEMTGRQRYLSLLQQLLSPSASPMSQLCSRSTRFESVAFADRACKERRR